MKRIILGILILALLAAPAVASAYWAVCCHRVLVDVDHGDAYYCNSCEMYPIKSSQTLDLPRNCQWYNTRTRAERMLHERETCK